MCEYLTWVIVFVHYLSVIFLVDATIELNIRLVKMLTFEMD